MTQKLTLFIYRGLPGIGKSTDARFFMEELRADGGLAVVIERDEIRREFAPDREGWYQQPFEAEVTEIQESRIKAAFVLGADVIVSDTNLPNSSVKRLRRIAARAGADSTIIDMRDPEHYPLETALSRNALRSEDKRVPEEYIKVQYERYIKGKHLTNPPVPEPDAEYEVEPFEQPENPEQWAVIFDIDGTLSIMGDRSPYDGHKVYLDTVNDSVARALTAYKFACYQVIIVTGRDAKYREVTEKWLSDNEIDYDEIYFRPENDNREDSIIKYEIFNTHIRNRNWLVTGVYDDRHRVLRMWRKLGLTTFHVNGPDSGNF